MSDSAPETVRIRAVDATPYLYGIWCAVPAAMDKPFVNDIVSRRWLPDGRISVMLDSFNFDIWDPDELIEVVPVELPEFRRTPEFEARVTEEAQKFQAERIYSKRCSGESASFTNDHPPQSAGCT